MSHNLKNTQILSSTYAQQPLIPLVYVSYMD